MFQTVAVIRPACTILTAGADKVGGVKDKFLVNGGARLQGSVRVDGAKNSVLKLMAAALLAEGTTTLTNCPEILDVPLMRDVLVGLGCEVEIDGHTVTIHTPAELKSDADFPAVTQFRASVCVLGPLTARCGRAVVSLPGGDAIGSRPLDMHQSGLEQLGATTRTQHGAVVAEAEKLVGAEISLDFPSVGATENILMASVMAEGQTTLDNAAREPEIVDLCRMLRSMGADIEGEGSPKITINGVEKLHPTSHEVIGDRIVAGTWAFAAAMTRGDVTVGGIAPRYLHLPLEKLKLAGAQVDTFENGFRVVMNKRPKSTDYQTLPFPGFPTDLQPMAIGLNAIADGVAVVTENVFESRFRFVDEMQRLGADTSVDGHHVVIRGIEELSSTTVWSSDIRAGAGLVIAALCAEGTTEVRDVFHIDRGYPNFVENLQALGADIQRVVG